MPTKTQSTQRIPSIADFGLKPKAVKGGKCCSVGRGKRIPIIAENGFEPKEVKVLMAMGEVLYGFTDFGLGRKSGGNRNKTSTYSAIRLSIESCNSC